MRAGLEKSAQAPGGLRDGVRTRNADGVEAVLARGLRKFRFQRFRRQKSRSA
jgi:hypothetical protein